MQVCVQWYDLKKKRFSERNKRREVQKWNAGWETHGLREYMLVVGFCEVVLYMIVLCGEGKCTGWLFSLRRAVALFRLVSTLGE